MPFRIETDAHLRAVLGTDGPAWANSYLRQQQHHDGDMRRIELAAWFDEAIRAGFKLARRTQAQRDAECNSGPNASPVPDDGA